MQLQGFARRDAQLLKTTRPFDGSAAKGLTSRAVLALCLLAAANLVGAAEPVELRLGSDEWPPFTGSPGKQRAAIELVHAALERAGIHATTTITDWKAVETGIRQSELDGSAAMWRTEQREKNLLFSEPYLENRLVLVGRKASDVSATRLSDLAGKRVAAVGHYAYGDEVDKAVGVLFVGTRNDQDSLDKLLAGEVEYMLIDELVAHYLLSFQSDEAAAKLEIGIAPLARRMLHFAIRRDVPNAELIVSAFNGEIKQMLLDGTFSEILRVGWIRVDVDGDGLYELVPLGEHVGEMPPGTVYDVFGQLPEDTAPEKERVLIQGNIYQGWDAIPDRYKGPPGVTDTTWKYGTTLMTLKF